MSSKKTTTDTNQTQNSVQSSTPTVPDWLLNPAQALAGNISSMTAAGPSGTTPITSGLQTQAFTGAGALDSTGSAYDPAKAAVGAVSDVNPQSLLDNLSSYYTPFKSQVLDPTLADFDANAGKTRAAQAAAAAQNNAFGGSRYGVQEAGTEDALARARATTEGGLLQNMYTQATGLSSTDAAARQAAEVQNQQAQLSKAGLLGNLASASSADQRANLTLQGQLGTDATNAANMARAYPLQYQQQMEGLLAGLNPSMFTGSTGTGSSTTKGTTTQTVSDPTGQLLEGLGSAAKIASLFTPMGPAMAMGSALQGVSNLGAIGSQGSDLFSKGIFAGAG